MCKVIHSLGSLSALFSFFHFFLGNVGDNRFKKFRAIICFSRAILMNFIAYGAIAVDHLKTYLGLVGCHKEKKSLSVLETLKDGVTRTLTFVDT